MAGIACADDDRETYVSIPPRSRRWFRIGAWSMAAIIVPFVSMQVLLSWYTRRGVQKRRAFGRAGQRVTVRCS
jgi:hypothetical protein